MKKFICLCFITVGSFNVVQAQEVTFQKLKGNVKVSDYSCYAGKAGVKGTPPVLMSYTENGDLVLNVSGKDERYKNKQPNNNNPVQTYANKNDTVTVSLKGKPKGCDDMCRQSLVEVSLKSGSGAETKMLMEQTCPD